MDTKILNYNDAVSAIREAIIRDIKDIFTKHGKTHTISWGEVCCNDPIICDSYDDESVYSLDCLGITEDGKLYFDASSPYDNKVFYWVGVEILLEVLEELSKHQNELFGEE